MKDDYDFNAEDLLFTPWRAMTLSGAKVFSVTGSRKDQVLGTLTIKNGEITDQNFEWQPIDKSK